MPKNTEISLNNYTKFLAEIQNHIKETQDNILKNVTRQKVEMAWRIGKSVDEHLVKNNKFGYGEKLIAQLAADTSLSDKVLYKMRNFYKTYKTLPKDDDSLNWTHYQTLSGVKKEEERKRLEEVVRENSWSTDQLESEVRKIKTNEVEKIVKSASGNSEKTTEKKLRSERGKLFSYPLITLEETRKTYIDCGFNFFREVEEGAPKAEAVDVTKKNKNYSLKKSQVHPRKFNTYKAYLERVVDGDTIRVTIDLGFKTMHQEIVRLKGIDAPELKTDAGKKSSRALSRILKNIPFFVIKTMKNDIYGRYVADVFLPDESLEDDVNKVAEEGVYLNQMLLDKGLAVFLDM
jgi:endonuclease YncB( thermonuclease family)